MIPKQGVITVEMFLRSDSQRRCGAHGHKHTFTPLWASRGWMTALGTQTGECPRREQTWRTVHHQAWCNCGNMMSLQQPPPPPSACEEASRNMGYNSRSIRSASSSWSLSDILVCFLAQVSWLHHPGGGSRLWSSVEILTKEGITMEPLLPQTPPFYVFSLFNYLLRFICFDTKRYPSMNKLLVGL